MAIVNVIELNLIILTIDFHAITFKNYIPINLINCIINNLIKLILKRL